MRPPNVPLESTGNQKLLATLRRDKNFAYLDGIYRVPLRSIVGDLVRFDSSYYLLLQLAELKKIASKYWPENILLNEGDFPAPLLPAVFIDLDSGGIGRYPESMRI